MGTASPTRAIRLNAALLLLAGALLLPAPAARCATIPCDTMESATAQKMNLVTGQSRILDFDTSVRNVAVADPGVADVLVLSPKRIYLLGKQPGMTNLTLICERGTVSLFELTVAPDIGRLKEKLHEIFPAEAGIKAVPANDGIMLLGTVSSAPALTQVLALVEPYAPKKVINLLQVGGVQQVMLEVRIAEMSRDTARRLGINLAAIASNGAKWGLSMINGIMGATLSTAGSVLTNQGANAVLHFTPNGNELTLFIDALKTNGLVNILAEPNLIAISGQRASFLAGGEFPYETTDDNGNSNVAWKNYGVELSFTPTVLSEGRIGLYVNPKVSSLGDSILVHGKLTPSLQSREVDTTIELADGQSFAIAGLLQHNIREVVDKFPVLGEIPVLGALFRSSSFQKNETELIVIATPHLVKPLNAAEQPLPMDSYVEPNDFEFFLLGSLEGKPPAEQPPAQKKARGGLDGNFGHIVPE
jgi:pilus assembly protein CpaC